jgi:tetratricopeptide (TPR) repeat protein
MKNIYRAASLIFMFIFVFISTSHAETPQQTLNQHIANLQKNPNDNDLREKIIRHVQTISPAPVVPEEAKRYLDRGMAAAEDAKNEKDYKDASDEFQKAVNIAPWLGAGYRGLAVTQDKSGQYAAALQNLKFFLLTNPSAENAEKAKTLRNKIEYRMEKAAKESSPEAIAAKKQKEYEAWLKKIDGRRYTNLADFPGVWGVLDIKGKFLVTGVIKDPGSPVAGPVGYVEHHHLEIRGNEAIYKEFVKAEGVLLQIFYIISEDGEKITYRSHWGNNPPKERIYLWKR